MNKYKIEFREAYPPYRLEDEYAVVKDLGNKFGLQGYSVQATFKTKKEAVKFLKEKRGKENE